jgi:peptidoglycan/LPS O-acetylase OafA/YrhL
MKEIAALAVVFFHISYYESVGFAPGRNLGVDFFFALSGFVLSKVYEIRTGRPLALRSGSP